MEGSADGGGTRPCAADSIDSRAERARLSRLTSRWGLPTIATAVRTKLGHTLIAFTLICAIGGHWAILQSVAWVGMVINYSQDSSLTVALQKTFDGEHPCKLCKVVRAGKKSEQKEASLKVETKPHPTDGNERKRDGWGGMAGAR